MRTRVVEIEATVRTDVGKSAAKRLRAAGQIPAVLYSRGVEPTPIAVNESAFRRALPEGAWHSTPLRVTLKGGAGGDTSPTAMVVDVQRDPIRDRIVAIDFHAISLDQPVRVQVPVRVRGELQTTTRGGVVEVLMHELALEALPTEIPDHVEADISHLEFHQHLRVSDLPVPPGVRVLAAPDEAVLVVTPPRAEVAAEAAAAAAAEEPQVLSEQQVTGGEAPG